MKDTFMAKRHALQRHMTALLFQCLTLLLTALPLHADITYSLLVNGDWNADVQNRIEWAMSEAVGYYNQYGSFNMHINVEYHPLVPTAEANYGGYLKFGGLIGTRPAMHEIAHTLGCGTFWAWGNNMYDGGWHGPYGIRKIKEFDGDWANLYGDKWHFWPYGLNYDSEDGHINRIRHIRMVAALTADMGLLSIPYEPTSQSAMPGTSATFTLEAANAQGYRWYKNGSPVYNSGDISGVYTNTLEIRNAEPGDEGRYHCVVSGGGQNLASRPAWLHVPHLIGQWNLDENANDSSGYGKHGTLEPGASNSIQFVDEGRNGCARFTNYRDRIQIPAVNIGNTFTVSAWIKADEAPATPWQRLITSHYATGFYVGRDNLNPNWTFTVNNVTVARPDTIQPNLWQHIVVTYDGTTKSAKMYINGIQSGWEVLASDPSVPNDIISIGHAAGEGDNSLTGLYDEIKIYDAPLSGRDVLALYHSDLLQFVQGLEEQVARNDKNDNVTFTVDIQKHPDASVTDVKWFRKESIDGGNESLILILDNDSKYNIEITNNYSTLTIFDVQTNDAAYYLARVSLDSGNPTLVESKPAQLLIKNGLVHRWSFSGNLNDSVGQAHGTLYNSGSHAQFTNNNTMLKLDNPSIRPGNNTSNISYITLPNGIFSAMDDYMTMEIWLMPHRINGEWTSFFCFGHDKDSSSEQFTGGTGLVGSLQVENTGLGFTYETSNNPYRWINKPVPSINEPVMYTMVWNGNTNTGTFYLNGMEIETRSLPGKLSDLNDDNNVLGIGYWNDLMANLSIDEMRLYDVPLPEYYIMDHYAAGPDEEDVNPCYNPPVYDFNNDCMVNMIDFALFSSEWMQCGRLHQCDGIH